MDPIFLAFLLASLSLATTIGAKLALVREASPESFEDVSSAGMMSVVGGALVARELFVAAIFIAVLAAVGAMVPTVVDVGDFWHLLAFSLVAVSFSESFEALLGAGFGVLVAYTHLPAPLVLLIARVVMSAASLLLARSLVPDAVFAVEAIAVVAVVGGAIKAIGDVRKARDAGH